jgi:hypothetical protein
MDIEQIIKKSKGKEFKKYTEFKLKNKINIKNFMYLIDKLKLEKNVNIEYNTRTYLCDVIGIIDLNGIRYYDFDDEYWSLINKGIY